MKHSIWQQANYRGKTVIIILSALVSIYGISVIHSWSKEPLQLSTSPTCITSKQADVLINNLHNASNTGNEGIRALNAIHAFHGKIVVVSTKTHEITFSWECLR